MGGFAEAGDDCETLVRDRSDRRAFRQPRTCQRAHVFGALVRLFLYRFLGARVMLALAIFGWLRRVLGGRRGPTGSNLAGRRSGSAYQPSQGESQTVHREPR